KSNLRKKGRQQRRPIGLKLWLGGSLVFVKRDVQNYLVCLDDRIIFKRRERRSPTYRIRPALPVCGAAWHDAGRRGTFEPWTGPRCPSAIRDRNARCAAG